MGRPLVRHERIKHIVNQRRNDQRVNRFKRNRQSALRHTFTKCTSPPRRSPSQRSHLSSPERPSVLSRRAISPLPKGNLSSPEGKHCPTEGNRVLPKGTVSC